MSVNSIGHLNKQESQQKAQELLGNAQNGDKSAVDEICNGIFDSTAGRLGTNEAFVNGIINNADSETLAQIMDRYKEVTGSEIYKDIENDFSGKNENEIIKALETAYLEINQEEYKDFDDGQLNNKQKFHSILKGIKKEALGIGAIAGCTVLAPAIAAFAGGALTAAVGATTAAAVATVAGPVLAVAGVVAAGALIYKGITNIKEAYKEGKNSQSDKTTMEAVTKGTQGFISTAEGAYIGVQSTKGLVESVKNIKSYNAAKRQAIEAEAKAKPAEIQKTQKNPEIETTLKQDESIKWSEIEDDGICGYDFGIYGSEGSSGADIRADMREHILSQSRLTDENLVVKSIDATTPNAPQLNEGSKYYSLGEARLNARTNEYVHICENLKDMPDLNGVRGKTPLAGKNAKGLKFRLSKIHDSGIETIIDLRSSGECSQKALDTISEAEMKYINIPIEDGNWSVESLDMIADYIKVINQGDYYVGCANGQARTDLAVGMNYVLNPSAKQIPQLYYGSASSSRVSVKNNIGQIMDLVKDNPGVVQNWGWNNYSEFMTTATSKLEKLIATLAKA